VPGNAVANVVADQTLDVAAGDRVTLYAANSWEWLVSYYGGTLKTGAVINPIIRTGRRCGVRLRRDPGSRRGPRFKVQSRSHPT
jgi:acyl-CoA synthetase (AMP-forming)/AMP-acid ligase II